MRIKLTNAGKRFNTEWIFRGLSYEFTTSNAYAITGANGSGKSTLLQIIAGATLYSEGTVDYFSDKPINAEDVYKYIGFAAPYLELIEEMTLAEFLAFQHLLKPFSITTSIPSIISILGLENATHKQMRYFSSGMKQRVKLAQAVFSDVPIVLLDEPCTNLDRDGISLYLRLIEEYCSGRLVIVSSNEKEEYQFCSEILDIGKCK